MFAFILTLILGTAAAVTAPAQGADAQAQAQSSEIRKPSPNALGTCWEVFSSPEVREWKELASAENSQWLPIILPASTGASLNSVLWYRTRFESPKLTSDTQRTFLCFDGIKFAAQIRIDGEDAGSYCGGSEPFELDVTSRVKDGGMHKLEVRVEGVTALAKELPEDFTVSPGQRPAEIFHETVLAPVGSQGFSTLGIWEPVRLEVRDTLSVEDLFIQTSWRERKITFDCTVRNFTDTDVTLPASASVEGTDIAFESQNLTVPAGKTVSFRMERPWKNPRVWSPRDPHLYFLTLSLGKCVAKRERFGFREIWCDGDRFMLNGVPFRSLGSASHPHEIIVNGDSKGPARDFFTALRRANINCVRLHANYWPKGWCETADEIGMPLILETGFFCWVHAYALNDAEFWENYACHIKALQKKHRNNPSFCFFSTENEILHCGGVYVRKDILPLLAAEGRKAKAFDATRPVSFDGDMDPEGVADVINPHYPMDFGGIRAGHEDCDWPQCCWWMNNGKFMACYPGEFWKWDRKKPLYFGEFLHIQQFRTQDPYALLLGDAAYDGPMNDVMAEAKAKAWRMQIPAYRAAGVSGMCPWVITEFTTPKMESPENPKYSAVQDSYEPVTFVLEPVSAVHTAGKKLAMKFWLINETDCVRELTLCVSLEAENHSVTKILNPSDRVPVVLEFTVPDMNSEKRSGEKHGLNSDLNSDFAAIFGESSSGTACVSAELTHRAVLSEEKPEWNPDWNLCGKMLPEGEDRFFLREGNVTRTFSVHVRRKFQAADSSALGFIGNPEIAKILKAVPLQNLNDRRISEIQTLIIGENALASLFTLSSEDAITVGAANQAQNRLAAFLAEPSHRVIILHQDEYPSGLLPIQLSSLTLSDPKNTEWTAFPSIQKPFLIPMDGTFLASGLFGGPAGLEYAASLTHENLMLTQVSVEEALLRGETPYFPAFPSVSAFSSPRPLYVYDPSGNIQKALGGLNVEFGNISEKRPEKEAENALILVNAEAQTAIAPQKGETFILCGLTPENRTRWEKILPEGLSLMRHIGRISPDFFESNSSARVNTEKTFETEMISGLYTGTGCDLAWYGERTGLTGRQTTPEQNIADWKILPFVPDYEAENPFPAMRFDEFRSSNPRGRMEKECFSCGTNVLLSHEISAPEGDYYLELEASGTKLDGIGVIFTIRLDGKTVGEVEADSEFSKNGVFIHTNGKTQNLVLAFLNDEWNPVTREDRNMKFRGARLFPVKIVTPNVYSTLSPMASVRISENVLADEVKWYAPDASAPRALRYIANILHGAGVRFTLPLGGVLIPGTDFDAVKVSPKSVAKLPGGKMRVGTNGFIEKKLIFAQNLRCSFTLRASGTACEGVYPHLNLRLDGKTIGEFQLQQDAFRNYTVSPDVVIPAGEHILSLLFDNDLYIPSTEPGVPNQDRNFTIEFLRVSEEK